MEWPAPTADERELLLGFLQHKREEAIATADGLDEDQLRWTPDGQLLPIIGIINHLAHVEWRWIEGRFAQHPFPEREEEFVVARDRTGAAVITAYRTQSMRTDEIVRSAPSLEAPCLGREGNGPTVGEMLGSDVPIDLRWAVLHLLEETAHHAGHADSTRELLDGTRMRG